MKSYNLILLLFLLLFLWLPTGEVQAQEPSGTSAELIDSLINQMSQEERVGQLFMVTFPGDDLSPEGVAARLVRDLHVGGVALRASNGNYQNDLRAVESLVGLTNGLQELTYEVSQKNGTPFVPLFIAVDLVPTTSPYADGLPQRGFTAIPSAMSLGATWNREYAEQVGRIVGQELNAVGINMLLGPMLDIVDVPYSDVQNSLTNHTFGDNPYWVGEMGRAFVRGVGEGAEGQVATVARHFPGMGGSDRAPDDEIATVEKPIEELLAKDMQPFFTVTDVSSVITGTVDGLMTTNLRYRALQGNVRQTTRPISLDAQSLPTLLNLPELEPWYETRGMIVSAELGTVALRRFYEQQFDSGTFPARTVAREAFNAGNDLLFLADFALTDDWTKQLTNIEETVNFFVEQYNNDAVFANKVDQSLRRLLALKLRLYDKKFDERDPRLAYDIIERPDPTKLQPSPLRAIENIQTVKNIAQESATLLYPDPADLASVLPAPPLSDEKIVIVTDARTIRDCAACPALPIIGAKDFEESLLDRYGPDSSGQLSPERITSLTFTQLRTLLELENKSSTALELQETRNNADWLIFLVQDKTAEAETDGSNALTLFLRDFNSQVRGQKLIVFSFGTPYYLDSTELSKITAYYAFYTPNPSFVDAAGLLLFQEYSASGRAPVSIDVLNYEIAQQLSPDPTQLVELCNDSPISPQDSCEPLSATQQDLTEENEMGLRTSVILDHQGNPVPDGTPIHFVLRYLNENVEQPRQTVLTENGVARTTIMFGRKGKLAISVEADNSESFESTSVQITLQGSNPPVIATATTEPTPTPTPTLTPTPTPSPTATPLPPTITPSATPTRKIPTVTPSITPSPTATAIPPTRFNQTNEGFGWWTLLGTLAGLLTVSTIGMVITPTRPVKLLRRTLLILLYGLIGYLIYVFPYAFRLLPEEFNGWGAMACALIGGLIALVRER
ncbi:MAG: glycoside hydrolase family 3 N-terminal domain-containing protein [Ardenticatenaceae bacterium]